MSTLRFSSLTTPLRALGLFAILATSACGVDKQTAPGISGPSELGLSFSVSAAPQVLPRDGSSLSTINISAFDANGKPKANQRVLVSTNAGLLSATDVVTNANGNVSVLYTAPGLNDRVSTVTVTVVPVESGDASNTNSHSVRIAVQGPSIPFAAFTFAPLDAAVLEPITFDASASTLDGVSCNAACGYSWDFTDGGSATGLAVSHAFATSGVFNVKLTVTSPSGTSNSITKPVKIAVPAPPEADFTISPSSPTALAAITFRSTTKIAAGTTITNYIWDFDDGTAPRDTGTTSSTILAGGYPAASTHNPTLTVIDSLGRQSTSPAHTITIP